LQSNLIRHGCAVPPFPEGKVTPHPSKIKDFCHLLLKEKALFKTIVLYRFLPFGGFFDTL